VASRKANPSRSEHYSFLGKGKDAPAPAHAHVMCPAATNQFAAPEKVMAGLLCLPGWSIRRLIVLVMVIALRKGPPKRRRFDEAGTQPPMRFVAMTAKKKQEGDPSDGPSHGRPMCCSDGVLAS
jgi:hypothetical protein